jgi:hypothetical protein
MCIAFHDSHYVGKIPLEKIPEYKNIYRQYATVIQKETDAEHVMYYRDERINDKIKYVWFYTPIILNDEKFEKEVIPLNSKGFLGVVHKH